MFLVLELDSLRKENRILRKKRGLACGCSGDCASHYQGFILFYAELFDPHVLLLAVQVRSKRKVFDQMSKYGKKKSLRDVRGLFTVQAEGDTVQSSDFSHGWVLDSAGNRTLNVNLRCEQLSNLFSLG